MTKMKEKMRRMRQHKNGNKGFTLVELVVVLLIMGILAALVGAGLTAYIRLARFQKNEANAKTIFQTAQIALTRKETAGEMEAFLSELVAKGENGTGSTPHFSTAYPGEADSEEKVARRNNEIYALFYDKADPTSETSRMVAELLGPYIYDSSLLDASICLEVDSLSGQVYSAFYDTNSPQLRFGEETKIEDRSYDHRRRDSLVGYYSAEDQVNVVTLEQRKLRVQSAALINKETLTLTWRGNSTNQDLDTVYTLTLYDEGNSHKKLYEITVEWNKLYATLQANNNIATLTAKKYNEAGTALENETGTEYNFPLTYSQGSFVLTLDAMADADLLRTVENDTTAAGGIVMPAKNSSLYSMTRLLSAPTDISVGVKVAPIAAEADNYIIDASEQTTETQNSLFATMTPAAGSATAAYTMTYYRHLYNTRWMSDAAATYTLAKENGTDHFDWLGGGVELYTASATDLPMVVKPEAKEGNEVAWPTIPVWGENMTLSNSTAATAAVTLSNLRLRGSSVAVKEAKKVGADAFDKYIGLIGENHGVVENLTLRDVDVLVNAELWQGDTTGGLQVGTADSLRALDKDSTACRPHVEAVGTVCGLNTGTVRSIALTNSRGVSPRVLAAVDFTDAQKTVTATNAPHGVGGIVGVAMPQTTGSAALALNGLTAPADMTVAGLLQEKLSDGTLVSGDAPNETEADEKTRYQNAALEPGVTDAVWRAIGVGGIVGVLDATNGGTDLTAAVVNHATVTGSGFTGGIVGNLYATVAAGGSQPTLSGLNSTGAVTAGNSYKTGSVLGQFYGGLAGYARSVTLSGCTGSMAANLNNATVTAQIKAGFDTNGALKSTSPLKGDFVGGLLGFGKGTTLTGCNVEKGYVMGRTFVGGFVGGFSGSTLFTDTATNGSNVFGHRYVGGAVAINGVGSSISGVTNSGLVSGMGKDAAYVGGIAAVNDAGWGDSTGIATADATAVITGCGNQSGSDVNTNTANAAFLQSIATVDGGGVYTADFVGGITGYNGKQGSVAFAASSTAQVKAVLFGGSFVGGVAGYNAPDAAGIGAASVEGSITAQEDCVGGFIGLNRKSELSGATVRTGKISGRYFVGGVIGANLPQAGFALQTGGSFTTAGTNNQTAGSVTANGVAGGIIGYNQTLAAVSTNADGEENLVGATQAARLATLMPSVDENGLLTESKATAANTAVTLTGLTNKLNVNANLYVGGIVGYNATTTPLTLNSAVNGASGSLSMGGINRNNGTLLPINRQDNPKAPTAVGFNAELGQLGTAYAASALDNAALTTGFAGGIIGINTANTTLTGCTNYGTILGHNAVVGGITALNLGTITNCTMDANLGNRQTGYLYIGGIAGVNAAATSGGETTGGTITGSSVASGRQIAGEDFVGGIVGANRTPRPLDATPADLVKNGDAVNTAKLGAYVEVPATLSGFTVQATNRAGGVAGVNYGTVRSTSSANLSVDVNATAMYAGGVAGQNMATGFIGALVREGGSVAATNRAGGIAGENAGYIKGCTNGKSDNTGGTVNTAAQYAGGIAGVNTGTLDHCTHRVRSDNAGSASVTAATGFAGGMAGYNGNPADATGNAALITGCSVSGAVRAASGEAGGMTAHNKGTVDDGTVTAVNATTRIYGTATALGAVTAYNQGTIKNITMQGAESANQARLAGPATQVGALAGDNSGTVQDCTLNNGCIVFGELSSAGATQGGAVGVNSGTVKSTKVYIRIGSGARLANITNLGGVVGSNSGTVESCVYSGTLGEVSQTATHNGDTVGGLVGYNHAGGTVSGTVQNIKLNAYGSYSVDASQSASDKLESASHVGGAVGRNSGKISAVTVVTDGTDSVVAARYGFVGGVAGSNNGEITTSGGEGTQKLVNKVSYWLTQTTDTADNNKRLNEMVDALRSTTKMESQTYAYMVKKVTFVTTANETTYTNLRGNDRVNDSSATNQLEVTLLGSNQAYDRANGYLGGITGFNATNGSVTKSATGQWFVYGNNVENTAAVGGAIGQNESNELISNVVNCAAVRRHYRTEAKKPEYDYGQDDNWNQWRRKSGEDTQIGGVIGVQQNRTNSGWTIAECVNYGSVFNSYSNNIGGVISYLSNNGGNITRCFNFGYLACNWNGGGGSSGAIGGIAGYFDRPTPSDTINFISCQNYGSILGVDTNKRANDCAGIFGKVQLSNYNDYMTINLYDCVNGNVTIQTSSMACGIMAYIGPYQNPVKNVTLNIDRCRNYSINLDAQGGSNINAGIFGRRDSGNSPITSPGKTTITNCFSLYNYKDKNEPISYRKDASASGENNYFMDLYSVTKEVTAPLLKMYETKGTGTQANTTVTKTLEAETARYQERRLFAGVDNGTVDDEGNTKAADYLYFGALMSNAKDANLFGGANKLNNAKDYITSADLTDSTIKRRIESPKDADDNHETKATLPLLFKETGVVAGLDLTDVTDEAIQNYYLYYLDTAKPGAPTDLKVAVSGSDSGANVYGRYTATWNAPEDSTVTGYHVKVTVTKKDTTTETLETDVFERRYVFEGKLEWVGASYKVEVWADNTKGRSENAAVLDNQLFPAPLPKPALEVRLAKTATGYEQRLVLTNTAEYLALQTVKETPAAGQLTGYKEWTVELTGFGVAQLNPTDTTGETQNDGSNYYVAISKMGVEHNTTCTGYAVPVAGAVGTTLTYMRSERFSEVLYIPGVHWTQGLVAGTLTFGETNITVNGTTVNDLSITAKVAFAPENAGLAPSYTVALVGKAKNAQYPYTDAEGKAQSLDISGQYVALASQTNAVTTAGTDFTFANLPDDVLTDFSDWQLVAYPTNSGQGPVTTVYAATDAELKDAIDAKQADIRTASTLELKRTLSSATGNYTYTVQHAAALGYLDNTTVGQVKKIALDGVKMKVLTAPTLQAFAEDGLPYSFNEKNELIYHFSWTQDGETTATAGKTEYTYTLYGVTEEKDADGKVTKRTETEIPISNTALSVSYDTATKQYTLALNIDHDLATNDAKDNGSESWRFDTVRLKVTRKASTTAAPKEIGAAGSKEYKVLQRLPKVGAPGKVGPADDEAVSAAELNYHVEWPAINDTTLLAHYTVYAEKAETTASGETWNRLTTTDADGKVTPVSWSTAGNETSMTINLEAYQGVKLRFYVVAVTKDETKALSGPNGAPDAGQTIDTRQAAPSVQSLAFDWPERNGAANPDMVNFLQNLKVQFTLNAASDGSTYYFTGYLYKEAADYKAATDLVAAWQAETTDPVKKAAAYKALLDRLQADITVNAETGESSKATLMISTENATVGATADSTKGSTAVSYTLSPSGDESGFTMEPVNAGQYMLAALHTITTDGSKAPSAWGFYTVDAGVNLPKIQLDEPAAAADEYDETLTATMKLGDITWEDELVTSHIRLQWEAVNGLEPDGTETENLVNGYNFTVTSYDFAGEDPGASPDATQTKDYVIAMAVEPADVTDTDGSVTARRGDIKTVTKTVGGASYPLAPVMDADGSVLYYDLSMDAEGNSQPVKVTGSTTTEEGLHPDYTIQCIPMLRVDQTDGKTVYQLVLPDLSKVVTEGDTLQKFTQRVDAAQAIGNGNTTVDSAEASLYDRGDRTATQEEPASSALEPATPESAAPDGTAPEEGSAPDEEAGAVPNAVPDDTQSPDGVNPEAVATALPSAAPTIVPSATPTGSPVALPSAAPTIGPAVTPTVAPAASPEPGPTAQPAAPTAEPSGEEAAEGEAPTPAPAA